MFVRIFFHKECYGYGMTRAIQYLIHFNVAKALYFNQLSLIVLPVLVYLWIKEAVRL